MGRLYIFLDSTKNIRYIFPCAWLYSSLNTNCAHTFKDNVEAMLPVVGRFPQQFAERILEHVLSAHVHGQVLAAHAYEWKNVPMQRICRTV